jgi:hypothetical protein
MKLLLSVYALFCSALLYADGETIVELSNGRVGFNPQSYFISGVADDRADKGYLGSISSGNARENMIMKPDVATTLDRFIESNFKQDKSLQPITLHVTKMNFNIRKKSGYYHISGLINFTFYAADRQLIEYTAEGGGDMDGDPAMYVDNFIRQTIEGDLKKFEEWWLHNKSKVPTASTVKVNFVIGKEIDIRGCFAYSTSRPLKISDFQGPPAGSAEEQAATYSGNGYAYKTETRDGQLVVDYTITPNFNTNKSWFKQCDQNASVLAHEQLHFDITALKTCEMISKMRDMVFTPENYEALLDKLPDQIASETRLMQDQYDTETNHGIIDSKQAEWETRIKEQLKKAGCY